MALVAGECGPRAGVGARVRMIRMPAPPNNRTRRL